MTQHARRRVRLFGLAAAVTLTLGCDDLVRRSVRDGVFSWVSGGISGSLSQNGAISDLLDSIFTGNLFGGGSGAETAAGI
jgi:hypothetical protein